MLGHQCFLKLREIFGVESVGCTLRKSSDHYGHFSIFNSGPVFDSLDISKFENLRKCLDEFRPAYIINCVGLTLRKPELGDIEKAVEINAMLPQRLALWGLVNNARVIHFSTDCIFDGTRGPYDEDSEPDAQDIYGKTKFLGELRFPNSLTMRLSIIGRELEGKTELVEWFLSKKGQNIKGYTQAMYSGITTNTAADEVARIIKYFPTLNGIFQVSSQPISKYDLLKIVNSVYNNSVTIEPDAKYSSNKILKSEKYTAVTQFEKPTWPAMIQRMKDEEAINYAK